MNVILHVDQENRPEHFWLKPQMAVNVQVTRLEIVHSSKNVQKFVNGVPGVNVVPHVDQENKAEKFL